MVGQLCLSLSLLMAPTSQVATEEQVVTLLESWKAAWETRDVGAYLSHYAPEFRSGPDDLGSWTAKKTKTFASTAWSKVEITDLGYQTSDDGWQVEFRQEYSSDRLRDSGFKTLRLVGKDKLLISSEEWVAVGRGRTLQPMHKSLADWRAALEPMNELPSEASVPSTPETSEARGIHAAGRIFNETNPANSVEADVTITLNQNGEGIVRIGPPLYGSGKCIVTSFNNESGDFTLVSRGPTIQIDWAGHYADGVASGKYDLRNLATPSLPERGTFSLQVSAEPQPLLELSQVLSVVPLQEAEKNGFVWIERNAASFHKADGSYTGFRMILDDTGAPRYVIRDFQNGSVMRDAKSQEVVLEWVTNGTDGYYKAPQGNQTAYLDRFLRPTGWRSIVAKDGTDLFLRDYGEGFEVFDAKLQPLGMRYTKTKSGRGVWAVTNNGVTEYKNENFKSLGWYSAVVDGRTVYATHDSRKQLRLFDENMRPIVSQKKRGFWSKLGHGLAVTAARMAPPPQAAGEQYGYGGSGYRGYSASYGYGVGGSYSTTTTQPMGNTTYSNTMGPGTSYSSTTTQRMGNATYANSYGSGGSWTNLTAQHLGNFEYVNGWSSEGAISGTRQHVGNLTFTNIMAPGGSWTGTSQQMGNFTFHNFTGPGGRTLSGTSQRIGNFVLTNLQ